MNHSHNIGFLGLGVLTSHWWPFLVRHNFQVVASIPGNSMPRKLLNLLTPFSVFLAGPPNAKQFTYLIDVWTR
jgi:hypothetical protein